MANQWFKFYGGEYLSDPKIERLSPLERSCWITILCMASMVNNGVIEFLTVESLLNRSGIQFDPYHPEEWEQALSVLVKFKSLKMIDTKENGQIIVINWEKRQEHNLTVAERVAKSRRNKKDVTNDVTNVTTEENRIEKNRIEENKDTMPDWLDKEVWNNWVEYRKEKKKALTPRSINLQLKELEKDQANHREVLEQSIRNGWTGIFPFVKGNNVQKVYKNTGQENMIDKLKAKTIK